MKRTLIAVPLVAALATAPLIALAAPAQADVTKRGACAGGTYEFQVDPDDPSTGSGQRAGYELSGELDRVAPGSQWTLVIKHDGQRVTKVTRTADREGDVDLEAFRPDTSGSDTFRFKAKPAAGGSACAATIRVG